MTYRSGPQERFQRIEVMYQAISDGNEFNDIALPNQSGLVKGVLEAIRDKEMKIYAANTRSTPKAFIIGVDDSTEFQGYGLRRGLEDLGVKYVSEKALDETLIRSGLNHLTAQREKEAALILREVEKRYDIKLGEERSLSNTQKTEYLGAVEGYMNIFELRESQAFVPAIRNGVVKNPNQGVVFMTSTHHVLSANFFDKLKKENPGSLMIVGKYSRREN